MTWGGNDLTRGRVSGGTEVVEKCYYLQHEYSGLENLFVCLFVFYILLFFCCSCF